jgi:non-ribosomal peptide synthase protein (TIGR01720 family)
MPTAELPALRTITVAGEACAADLVERWAKGRQFFNLYGPTEATIWATAAACCDGRRPPPIGLPISNTQVFVLDQHLCPVPIGVPGELHIGGVGLARGYLNLPELTAATFIPNPFSQQPGARLYKTGDLARYLPDGNIEFLGRIDHQVKLRGFRIELGEIEAALRQHPAVQETIVLVREDKPGEKRLVAYVVARQEPAPSISALRHFLQETLPVYMVPAAFVWLQVLPTTPNGKVDRRTLPAPEQARPALEAAFLAPRTVEEHLLASVWSEVLGLAHVGIHDNFFELGGDSMLSIQVIARAHQAGLWFTPTQLFQYPTIAGLAQVAGTTEAIRAEQGMVMGHVPLTPIQHWFFAHQQHDLHHWNWAFLREVPQALEPALLARTMQYLLLHHDALRLRFHQSEAGWQQVNAPEEASVPLTVVDLSMVAAADLRETMELATAACQASLSLAEGPLLRVAYFSCGGQQADRVLIVFHHLVVDVVSARILMEDFQTAYEQLRHGKAVRFPPKSTSFQDWARRLSAYAQSPVLRQELPYWTRISKTGLAPLPVDYPGGVHSEASVSSVTCSLSTAETQALLEQFPAAYGVQIQEVLLTALIQSFVLWAGKRTLLVELEGHGREGIVEDVDLSRTVGWFTTIFPVLLDLGEVVEPREALQAVQAQVRGIPQRGIGFGLLRYLCEENDVRQHMQALPRAEVNFNYLGQLDQTLAEAMPFRRAQESTGPERSWRSTRSHLLYIVGLIGGGKLYLRWSYSKNQYRRETIERLASNCAEALRGLITHCLPCQGL